MNRWILVWKSNTIGGVQEQDFDNFATHMIFAKSWSFGSLVIKQKCLFLIQGHESTLLSILYDFDLNATISIDWIRMKTESKKSSIVVTELTFEKGSTQRNHVIHHSCPCVGCQCTRSKIFSVYPKDRSEDRCVVWGASDLTHRECPPTHPPLAHFVPLPNSPDNTAWLRNKLENGLRAV